MSNRMSSFAPAFAANSFSTASVSALVGAVHRFEQLDFDACEVARTARGFGKARFVDEMRAEVDRVLDAWPKRVDGTTRAAEHRATTTRAGAP